MAAATHIVVFGCPRAQCTFRALVPGPVPHFTAKPPPVIVSECPGCGAEHAVPDTFGRPFQPGDEIDVSLAGFIPAPDPEPVAVPPLVTHERGVPKVCDERLLASIPTDRKVLAADIARALGYALTFTLIERIERLNSRAVSAWGTPVVRIVRTNTGRRPTYLERVVVPEVASTP